MKRLLCVLLVLMLCACARGTAETATSAENSTASAASGESTVSEPASEEVSAEETTLPELSGTFIAAPGERVDEFADGRQQTLGTAADKQYFDAILAALRENTAEVRFTYSQGDTFENFALTSEQCEALVSALKGASYAVYTAAPGNPPTGGGWEIACYRADGTEIIYAAHNGEWLTLSDNDVRACIFDGSGFAAVMESLASTKQS